MAMLMRTDPFRELDRLAEQVLGTATRPAMMPIDAWRDGDTFVVGLDLPGVSADSIDLDQQRNVLTVKAERPRGVFSRQLFLGDTLDAERLEASYADGVLTLRVPVAEKARPRKIEVVHGQQRQQQAIPA
jgi:HSP20 family protein